jgi:nucleotide-binding universal stress UspA family protein
MAIAPSYGISQIYNISEPDTERIKDIYEKNAQAIIAKANEIFLEKGREVETRLIYDIDPVSYIKKVVKKEQVDLVIIGSKGTHSLLGEILLGSVAEKVLRHIPVDILIIR